MNENEALKILDNVCSQTSMNRESHIKVLQAVEILKEFIRPKTSKEEKK
jgi:hypothetical protein